ncbi:peptide-methionine (R)-S-oxide reductase MsrB [Paenibacillus glycanilyticus]|uniref:peptide-methionine (R)-S-oxide reductase MsrB n=1 Tax=Paenibacillus glycanilyticus TaxID=126569 RepID=UPI001F1DD49A|nr:peptide-methionine (R)-S-oxide reductase MsrB [Paenibacillus glycanilyticus]
MKNKSMQRIDTTTDTTFEEKLKTLSPLQYQVTQLGMDEPAYNNKYWNNKEEGIYVDVVSGVPLFSSKDKYDARTGWPSFTKPIETNNIVLKRLGSILGVEIRSRHANTFIGHVFKDGPLPKGLRFCTNSAAMEFIPKADLEKRGYGEYTFHFNEKLKNEDIY